MTIGHTRVIPGQQKDVEQYDWFGNYAILADTQCVSRVDTHFTRILFRLS